MRGKAKCSNSIKICLNFKLKYTCMFQRTNYYIQNLNSLGVDSMLYKIMLGFFCFVWFSEIKQNHTLGK